jgi:hypothetical protein
MCKVLKKNTIVNVVFGCFFFPKNTVNPTYPRNSLSAMNGNFSGGGGGGEQGGGE